MLNNRERREFQMLLSSKQKLFDLNFRELFRYRDLIFLLVKRDFVANYKQTVLGPLWAVIQPILTTVVFTVIFGNLAGLTIADSAEPAMVPAFLFYMSGTVVWNYFSSVVGATSNTFVGNSYIMGKVYFPRLVIPVSTTLSNCISFGIRLCLFMVLYLWCIFTGRAEFVPTVYVIMIPLIFLQLMILAMSIGIIVSSLTTKYRDLIMLVGFGLQLWQYASPVAYGLQLIPEKWIGLYMMNPVTQVILTFRYAVFGAGFFQLKWYLISWGITVLLCMVGIVLFQRIEKTFMDTV